MRRQPSPQERAQPRSVDGYFSPNEVAAFLGVPLQTIYRSRYRHEGPPGYRVGRHLRYRATDVEQWLEEHRDAS